MNDYCVYAHYIDNPNMPFYIGSGQPGREDVWGRNLIWHEIAKDGYKVEVLRRGLTRDESHRQELMLQLLYAPDACVQYGDGKYTMTADSTREKCSKAKMGNTIWLGKKHSLESNTKNSSSHTGKTPSLETKNKLSKAKMGNTNSKGKTWTMPKVQCPHCNKVGGSGPMTRYHFDNCKKKEL